MGEHRREAAKGLGGHRHGRAHGRAHGHPHGFPHGHAHHSPDRVHAFDAAYVVAIGLNLGFVAIEAGFGWQAGSLALLADAGHNLSDVAGLVLAWAGALAGRVRPDARHTYGWQRGSILAAFGNAVLLLVAMGSLAWEAVDRLKVPASTDGATVMIVAAVGIVVNMSTALLFLRGREHDLNVRGAFLHMAGDALVSAGVVLSGGLMLLTQWSWIDPLVSLLVAVLIVAGTWSLFRQSLNLLFDGVPEGLELAEIEASLRALAGVDRVHDLHVWATGTSRVAMTAHLVMPDGPPGDAFLAEATAMLQHRFGIGHATLQVVRAPFTPPCSSLGSPFAPDDA
ncbi:MAG: hypothetical protein RIS35_3774 [Pseudomonadota bacterium]